MTPTKPIKIWHRLIDVDCFYSCPLAVYSDGESGYCGPEEDTDCDCGADRANEVMAALARERDTALTALTACQDQIRG